MGGFRDRSLWPKPSGPSDNQHEAARSSSRPPPLSACGPHARRRRRRASRRARAAGDVVAVVAPSSSATRSSRSRPGRAAARALLGVTARVMPTCALVGAALTPAAGIQRRVRDPIKAIVSPSAGERAARLPCSARRSSPRRSRCSASGACAPPLPRPARHAVALGGGSSRSPSARDARVLAAAFRHALLSPGAPPRAEPRVPGRLPRVGRRGEPHAAGGSGNPGWGGRARRRRRRAAGCGAAASSRCCRTSRSAATCRRRRARRRGLFVETSEVSSAHSVYALFRRSASSECSAASPPCSSAARRRSRAAPPSPAAATVPRGGARRSCARRRVQRGRRADPVVFGLSWAHRPAVPRAVGGTATIDFGIGRSR